MGLGEAPRDDCSRRRRSSATPDAAVGGCGECLGERPCGDFVRWVPKLAALCEGRVVEPGVLGPFGAENGPVWVGVMARVEAAMRWSWGKNEAQGQEIFSRALVHSESAQYEARLSA